MPERNEGLEGLRRALDDALAIRAAYHHAEEWERPMLIVKYMDARVSELEAALAAPVPSSSSLPASSTKENHGYRMANAIALAKSAIGDCVDKIPYVDIHGKLWDLVRMLYELEER